MNNPAPQFNFFQGGPPQNGKSVSDYASDAYKGVADAVEPVYQNAVDSVKPAFNRVSEMTSEGISNIQKGVTDILPKMPSLDDSSSSSSSSSFSLDSSSSNSSETSGSFFQLNSIVTKVAFLLFIVILFLLLVKLTMTLMAYLYQKKNNPLLINGSLNAKTPLTITRDPLKEKSVALPRSNNQFYGAEFTWSTWLNVQSLDDLTTGATGTTGTAKTYYHVFSVGTNEPGPDGLMTKHNAPGLYLTKRSSSNSDKGYDLGLHVVMDTEPFNEYSATNTNALNSLVHHKEADVSDLPFNNWFHVVVRLENAVLDVYINGTIVSRIHFDTVPKQNFYDIQVCQNNGFQGFVSNLQYYAHALNIFDINALVLSGPNTKMAIVGNGPNIAPMNSYDYLSNMWYYKNN